MLLMWTYSKNPILEGAIDQKKPERNREAVLAKAAEMKRERARDASRAMQEIEAKKAATLAKTKRLRAERLARMSEEAATDESAPVIDDASDKSPAPKKAKAKAKA